MLTAWLGVGVPVASGDESNIQAIPVMRVSALMPDQISSVFFERMLDGVAVLVERISGVLLS